MASRTMIPRVIPCLLLKGSGLVKTVRFKNPVYVGDPRIAVKIFNEKEVDELVLLDIVATGEKRTLQFDLIEEIASECFMPLAYGGGICNLGDIERLFCIGLEKIVINSAAVERPQLIEQAAARFGSQSIVVSIDSKDRLLGKRRARIHGGTLSTKLCPIELAIQMEQLGAGEILLNSMDRDGLMTGYDLDLIRAVSAAVRIPVVACGGAGSVQHLADAVGEGAAATAAGSMFVFQGKHRAVLIHYPERRELSSLLQVQHVA